MTDLKVTQRIKEVKPKQAKWKEFKPDGPLHFFVDGIEVSEEEYQRRYQKWLEKPR